MDAIEEGFEVFVSGNDKPFGAVRRIARHGGGELVIYVENAGDFTVSREAVAAVRAQKVMLDPAKLDKRLRDAIRHAHDAEDPSI
ncbi:MAG: hypothetical protein EHM67_00120 [Hyphomicrobiaceae bacterium]|nr:MAG: hypothetical protein EHM67_00120 [Hyphomicrobiaceae bacterium]